MYWTKQIMVPVAEGEHILDVWRIDSNKTPSSRTTYWTKQIVVPVAGSEHIARYVKFSRNHDTQAPAPNDVGCK